MITYFSTSDQLVPLINNLSHMIPESAVRDKWTLHSMSWAHCHGEITTRPKIKPATPGLHNYPMLSLLNYRLTSSLYQMNMGQKQNLQTRVFLENYPNTAQNTHLMFSSLKTFWKITKFSNMWTLKLIQLLLIYSSKIV